MYKIKEFSAGIFSENAETIKRFNLVKSLSQNFTVHNDVARQLDELLYEQFSKQKPIAESKKVREQSRTKKNGAGDHLAKNTGLTELEESFNELFEALKNHTGMAVDKSGVERIIRNFLKDRKIGIDQLDSELQRLLDAHPRLIKYDIPSVPTLPFAKPPIDTFQSIVDDIMMGGNVMLIGGAGTGKTFLAENLIAKLALGRNYLTINCSQWTSPTEIIGGQTMDGYQEGKLIEAWVNGYVLILDELPKIDPNTAGLFNDALAKTRVKDAVIFNSRRESFTKHENFACIATGNIYPDKESVLYGANNRQDMSLLDRFSGSIYFIEKNPVIEKQILGNEMIWSICNELRSAIEELKYEAQLSLRFMQNARDTYNLEMARNEGETNGISANEGKTFKTAIDSFLSVFTLVQQKNLKERIRYEDLFTGYSYRQLNIQKPVF